MKSKPSELLEAEVLAIEDEWQRRLSHVRRLLRPGPLSEGRFAGAPMHRCQACGRPQDTTETLSTLCGRCDKLAADVWMEVQR